MKPLEKERWRDMKSVKGLLIAALVVLAMVFAAAAFAQDKGTKAKDKELNLRAYTELLRADLKAKRVAIITEIMDFDDKDAAAFWPVFKQYDQELTKIGDSITKLVLDYVDNYSILTDAKADELMTQVFAIEAQRAQLKKKYFDIMKKAIAPVQAARFFQIENQIQRLVDLQLSASLPTMQEQSKQ